MVLLRMKIIVAGIGPGSREDITPAVMEAVAASNVIVGYKYYFQFIEEYLSKDAICVDSGMRKERERAQQAFEYALQGNTVCVERMPEKEDEEGSHEPDIYTCMLIMINRLHNWIGQNK